jgi:hypothetical protein
MISSAEFSTILIDDFRVFPQSLQENARIYRDSTTTASFQILSNSLFINPHIIRRSADHSGRAV